MSESGSSPDSGLLLASKNDRMSFSVAVAARAPLGSTISFRATGPDPRSGALLTREYELTREYNLSAASQGAYLNLFEALARDFGTRVPASRRRVSTGEATAPFRPLLTRSLSPDVLYGYGDPAVLRVENEKDGSSTSYFAVVTSGDAPQTFPILRSRDLRDWELAGFAFPDGEKPAWAAEVEHGGEYWAPELSRVGDRFVLCFAAREKDLSLAVGLAWSASPAGRFVPSEQPLLRGGVIDPHVFVDEDGSAFLFWKEDSNDVWPSLLSRLLHHRPEMIEVLFPSAEDKRTACFSALLWPWVRTLRAMERFFVQQVLIEAVVCDFSRLRTTLERMAHDDCEPALRTELARLLEAMHTVIYGRRLDTDRWTLRGEPSAVLRNDLGWEGALVEGAWVTKRQGKYYLFYSGNDFSTAQYGIGVAVAESALGPYTKIEPPFLRSTADWWGPGHPSVADGPDGRPWLFFHAYRPGQVGYKQFRALLALPLAFENHRVAPGRLGGAESRNNR